MIRMQLWRNATLQLRLGKTKFLIDPMLGEKSSIGPFPYTEDKRQNPLVPLPFSETLLQRKLDDIDAVFVSHLHPDHWDEAAVQRISKATTIICPSTLVDTIEAYGFQDVHGLQQPMTFNSIEMYLTDGQHGTGAIEEKMGAVNGIVFRHQNQRIYIAGDTIWCPAVEEALDRHQPQHVIVAGGAATFSIGEPVTMTGEHIKALAAHAPNTKIWITHMEAVSPCKEGRATLSQFLKLESLLHQCHILGDGEEVHLQ
ncbi:MBL fold metallo-hydrolase [Flagellimonas profundi]|uniref:MBL fold metallo-hydrolase n=1 Tax=Flagellimonas profundi TaxID=2915620 RepID=A0ABS3FJX2_9FLAO|nr:MBL fold metallo-hydrolase [Allomuricauda profundi]MBO0343483.1 MBL fold metallo-hydrolase [Allomuricauda profundi]